MGSMACGHCGSKEHSTGDCPHGFFSTACAKCGSLDHASSDCPHGIFSEKCSRCGSKEHATGDCPHGVFSAACAKCGSLDHGSGDCPHGILSAKCSRCGSRKHATDDCPQGLFPTRRPVSETQQTTSTQSDDNGCAKLIGGLIGIAILVAVVVWLFLNVVLPLALLNSALIFTILALTIKDHKPVFASLTLAGAGYMLFDISNGWLSANFVNNVVKAPEWLTAIVYLNAAAVGVSVWILVQPLFQKAAAVGASNKHNGILLSSIAAGALVVAPMVLLPAIHHLVGTPFSNRMIATPVSSTTPAASSGAAPVSPSTAPESAVTTREVSSLSKASPEPTAALFHGKWQLVEGELHPVTKQIVKSFLTIAGTPDTPTVVWTSELDGSVDHTISLKYTRGSLTGDYYGGKGNVAIEMLSDGRLSFTIDPYAEFTPIKGSIYARVLDTNERGVKLPEAAVDPNRSIGDATTTATIDVGDVANGYVHLFVQDFSDSWMLRLRARPEWTPAVEVDVNQNGVIDAHVDVAYGRVDRTPCFQYLIDQRTSSLCGAFESSATLEVIDEPESWRSTIWKIPKTELTMGGQSVWIVVNAYNSKTAQYIKGTFADPTIVNLDKNYRTK